MKTFLDFLKEMKLEPDDEYDNKKPFSTKSREHVIKGTTGRMDGKKRYQAANAAIRARDKKK